MKKSTTKEELIARIRGLEKEQNELVRKLDEQRRRGDRLANSLATDNYMLSDLRMALRPFTKSTLCRLFLREFVDNANTVLSTEPTHTTEKVSQPQTGNPYFVQQSSL